MRFKVSATVYFDYQPREEAVMNPIELAEPGCDEEASITDVTITIEGIKMSVLSLMPSFYVTELEERAIAWINEQGEE